MEELIVRQLQDAGWRVEVGYDASRGFWAKARRSQQTIQTGTHPSLLAALEELRDRIHQLPAPV